MHLGGRPVARPSRLPPYVTALSRVPSTPAAVHLPTDCFGPSLVDTDGNPWVAAGPSWLGRRPRGRSQHFVPSSQAPELARLYRGHHRNFVVLLCTLPLLAGDNMPTLSGFLAWPKVSRCCSAHRQ